MVSTRIGGRCLRRKTIQNWWVDLGGQWIGKTHHLFSDLTQELKLRTFDSHFEGDSVLMLMGQRLVRPMEEPWATPGVQELASETVESWMRRQTDSEFA